MRIASRQDGSGSHPAHAAAHGFEDGDRLGQGTEVHAEIPRGLRNVAGGAGVARAAIGGVDVVVDGLGRAHHAQLVVLLSGEPPDLVRRVHGAVAADEEGLVNVVGAQVLMVAESSSSVGLRREEPSAAPGLRRIRSICVEWRKLRSARSPRTMPCNARREP